MESTNGLGDDHQKKKLHGLQEELEGSKQPNRTKNLRDRVLHLLFELQDGGFLTFLTSCGTLGPVCFVQ